VEEAEKAKKDSSVDPEVWRLAGAFLAGLEGEGLDLVHLTCLARCATAVAMGLSPTEFPADRDLMADRLLTLRRADGGWAMTPEDPASSTYGTFLAVGAHQDLDLPFASPSAAVDFLRAAALDDGGYGSDPSLPVATTPTTAAAVVALRQLGAEAHPKTARWLRRRLHRQGGFLAAKGAPMPDLLSTAVALHALSVLDQSAADLAPLCLDFVDTLWTSRGAFFGHWADDTADCEYTYYGLLALGHLAVWSEG
jgi:prenyltransferase beta subunit